MKHTGVRYFQTTQTPDASVRSCITDHGYTEEHQCDAAPARPSNGVQMTRNVCFGCLTVPEQHKPHKPAPRPALRLMGCNEDCLPEGKLPACSACVQRQNNTPIVLCCGHREQYDCKVLLQTTTSLSLNGRAQHDLSVTDKQIYTMTA